MDREGGAAEPVADLHPPDLPVGDDDPVGLEVVGADGVVAHRLLDEGQGHPFGVDDHVVVPQGGAGQAFGLDPRTDRQALPP